MILFGTSPTLSLLEASESCWLSGCSVLVCEVLPTHHLPQGLTLGLPRPRSLLRSSGSAPCGLNWSTCHCRVYPSSSCQHCYFHPDHTSGKPSRILSVVPCINIVAHPHCSRTCVCLGPSSIDLVLVALYCQYLA